MNQEYHGIYAALVVPYTTDGKVNHAELARLVNHLIDNGIDGFYVNGSTGEAFLLSEDERNSILETVVEANSGRKKVICHVGSISTDQAIRFSQHAENVGADAVSAISPFYYKFGKQEIIQYYHDIMNNTSLPMFIYNFPNFSGFSLSEDVLDELTAHKNLAGVKFTSSDFFLLERIKTNHPELVVWNGFDEMLCAGLIMGADGAIGSTYNCMAPIVHKIYDNFINGNIEEAQEYQKITNTVIKAICNNGVFASVKTILEFDGFAFNGCRKPFSPITDAGKKELKGIYEEYIVPNR